MTRLRGSLHLRDDSFKGLRFVFGESGEDFAVNRDAFYLEGVNELAVGKSEWARGGVDADVPECAEVTLLVFSVVEGVFTRMHESVPSHTFLGGTAMAITLSLL